MASEYSPGATRGKRCQAVVCAIAIIFVFTAQSVYGLQNPPNPKPGTASIQGTVTRTDDQGRVSVMQGVQIKLTAAAGAAPLSTTTDDHGHFSFSGLAAGNYTLEGTLDGFQAYKVDVKLEPESSPVQDFAMKLSAVTQSVEVNAEADAISTQSANTNATLTAKETTDVPLAEQKFKAKMILQVHDELLFEAPHNEIDRLRPLVREAMENVRELAVPLVVDLKAGPNWRDMK